MSKTPRFNRHPPATIHVTLRAVIQRIKRKLAKEGKTLVTNRFAKSKGSYHVVDDKNIVFSVRHVGALAVQLGVLKPWESIA